MGSRYWCSGLFLVFNAAPCNKPALRRSSSHGWFSYEISPFTKFTNDFTGSGTTSSEQEYVKRWRDKGHGSPLWLASEQPDVLAVENIQHANNRKSRNQVFSGLSNRLCLYSILLSSSHASCGVCQSFYWCRWSFMLGIANIECL